MREEIINKLYWGLAKACKQMDEPLVIFLLVKIRKLLEESRFDGQYLHLKFYCDWPLHRKLDRRSARAFLTRVEDIIQASKDDKFATEKASRLLDFSDFWEDLKSFLTGEGLPTDVVEIAKLRLEFFRWYSSAIQDTPLEYSDVGRPKKQTSAMPIANRHISSLSLVATPQKSSGTSPPVHIEISILTHEKNLSYKWELELSI